MCSNKEFHWSLLMISCWCVKTKNFIGHFWWSHIDVFKQRISLVISEWWSHIDVFKQRISLVISEWWSHIDVFKQRIPVVISDYLILMFQTKNFICCRFWLYHWCVQTKNFISRFWLYDIDVFRPHFYYHSWWIMILWYNLWIFVNVYKHFLIKIKITWLSNLLVLSAPDEGYSRNMFYALNLTSIFFIANCSLLFVFRQNHVT
jgi:hypothetical protein